MKIRVILTMRYPPVVTRFPGTKDLKIFFENVKLECHYCGISEEKIKEMAKVNKFNTIRFYYNRGRSLEIDRKDPSLNYSVDNMVLCCYWCNNAKTDEFTEEEFKAIGSVINLIWKIRNCKKIDK
ncbi:MAG: hypothetical protein NTU73_13245 [Ignavibacteriae bacterium]|nr:hypothetical protein [Ignavibacteriota bacterium]